MKQRTILLLLCVIFFGCNGSDQSAEAKLGNGYEVIGEIKGLPDSTWIYLDQTTAIDSTLLMKEQFVFKGAIAENARQVLVRVKGTELFKFFWLENNKIQFTADRSDFKQAKIIGSASEDTDAKLYVKISKQQDTVNSLARTVETLTNGAERTKIMTKIAVLEKYIEQQQMLFIAENAGSLVAVDLLDGYSSTWGKEKTQYLYDQLSEVNKNSKEGKNILEYLTLSKNVAIGSPYANFVQFDEQGKKVAVSELIGKPLLIEFWASWCIPCRRNNPDLLKVYQKFHPKGFEILGVSADEDKAAWLKAVKEDSLTWRNVSELNGETNRAAKVYNINKFPTNFLIDQKGIIIAIDVSNEKLEQILNKLL